VGFSISLAVPAYVSGIRLRPFLFSFFTWATTSAYWMSPRAAGNPLLVLVSLMLLLANIRATILSRKWITNSSEAGDADLPERSLTTWRDRFANRMPVILWPKVRWVFYPLISLTLVLAVIGMATTPKRTQAVRPEPLSTTLTVRPGN
jgi:hypothetical protein